MRCSSFGIDFLAGQQANGGTTIVTVTDLTATDVDNTNGQLVNTVTGTLHGAVLLGGIATASFTEADLVANAVSFQHDGSATNGRFTVSLTDGTAAPQTATVIAAVDLPGNNPPVLAGDLGIAVANGSTVIVTATDLTATDSDNTNAQLVYTVTGASHGTEASAVTNLGEKRAWVELRIQFVCHDETSFRVCDRARGKRTTRGLRALNLRVLGVHISWRHGCTKSYNHTRGKMVTVGH
jgi:hypothetical protein